MLRGIEQSVHQRYTTRAGPVKAAGWHALGRLIGEDLSEAATPPAFHAAGGSAWNAGGGRPIMVFML
jgi:hypothetical protein